MFLLDVDSSIRFLHLCKRFKMLRIVIFFRSKILFIALAQRDAGIPSGALMSTCQLCTGAIIMIASVHVECAAHRMAVYQSAPSNSCAISRYHRVTVVRSNFDEESFDFAFLMFVLDAALKNLFLLV